MLRKRKFSSPGRVNLIGEHTDYTGGLVLPIAIPFETTIEIAPSSLGCHSFYSTLFQEEKRVTTDGPFFADGKWSDYPIGVLGCLRRREIRPPAFHATISGNVPLGAGLSSSASVEVTTAIGLLSLVEDKLSAKELALLCQEAENTFVGSPCGIMDQFVITAARSKHALLLNTQTLDYEHLPLDRGIISECSLVIVNSMLKHSIAGGDYGKRRNEVEAGQSALRGLFPEATNLGHANLAQLNSLSHVLAPESLRRCRHVISENARVLKAKDAINSGDAVRFGALMVASHKSQRDDFECSTPEIDFLVDAALSIDGCYGARLTGGGFGGCTVNLVERSKVDEFIDRLGKKYLGKFAVTPEVYTCHAMDGAMARAEAGANDFSGANHD